MELKLTDGKYSAAAGGGVATVSREQELAQRAAMKLSARHGRFWPYPEYGSELYRLVCGERPADLESTVRQYVEQALSDETQLSLEAIRLEQIASDSLRIYLHFTYTGGSFDLTLNMEDGYENA